MRENEPEPLTPDEVSDLLKPYSCEQEERAVMAISRCVAAVRACGDAMNCTAEALRGLRKAYLAIPREQRTYTPRKR